MRPQGNSGLIPFILFFLPSFSLASAPCFDLSKRPALELFRGKVSPARSLETQSDFGSLEEGKVWAALNAVVQKPTAEVLALLLDHNTTKSPRVDEMHVTKADRGSDAGYLERHNVDFVIRPFPLVTIRWREDWGYALRKGTHEKPEEVLILYQKIQGTSHIKHLCGSVVIRSLSDTSTQVFQYEEARATSRSAEDTLKGLRGTVIALQK